MYGPRAAAVLVGLGLVASLSAATAQAADERVEVSAPELPEVTVVLDSHTAPARPEHGSDLRAADIPPPDVPSVSVSVPALAQSESPATEIALPQLPEPTVTLTAADRIAAALSARLGDTGNGKGAALSPRLPRQEREAIAQYYEQNGYRPVWVQDGAWTSAAKRAMDRLKSAADDALDPSDYPTPSLTKAAQPDEIAQAELMLSASVVLYARDARGARIDPSRLSNHFTPKLELPTVSEVLSRISAAENADAALASYNPPHAGYQALREKLAQIRSQRPGRPMVQIPKGPALRIGMRDPRVPLIRARFGLGPTGGDETAYDKPVALAVTEFQKETGLPANGVLTAQTVAALSKASGARLEGDIIANMERWRWLPTDLGSRHIAVNVPEFRLRIVNDSNVVHQARVIVGKPESPTPVFSDTMEHIVVNPSWTVPPSILKNEILPALARDPSYAERRGYQVIRKGNRIIVRQPPGERNALGFIKFLFPNQHAVYLHDTPNRNLFSASRRAFSHGCVRVDQPFRLAEEVLGRDGTWSEARMRSLIGKGERHIKLRDPLPVHLTYFTVTVDERGEIKTFDDLYGFNQKVRTALGIGT